MRRAPIVITGTVAGMAALLTFKPAKPELPSTLVASASPTPDPSSADRGASAPASPSTAGGGSTSAVSGTATGEAVDTQYGAAQVRVTVKDGRITKVEPVQLQSNDPKSVQISSYAAPLLAQSALTKQSGDLDAVSGATFTSTSYEASLQSALDKLGFEAQDGSRGNTDTSTLEQSQGGDHGVGGGHEEFGDGDRPPGPPPGGWR